MVLAPSLSLPPSLSVLFFDRTIHTVTVLRLHSLLSPSPTPHEYPTPISILNLKPFLSLPLSLKAFLSHSAPLISLPIRALSALYPVGSGQLDSRIRVDNESPAFAAQHTGGYACPKQTAQREHVTSTPFGFPN